jgi:predicted dehydrogenase
VLVNDGPYAQSIWRQAYAGALLDIGPHVLSVLIPLLGAVADISAQYGDDRVVTFTTRHAGGARAEVSLSLHENASAVGSAHTFRNARRQITLPEPAFSRPGVYSRAAGDLLAAIASGDHAHRCDLRLGMTVVEILDAATRSIDTGRTVDIPRVMA